MHQQFIRFFIFVTFSPQVNLQFLRLSSPMLHAHLRFFKLFSSILNFLILYINSSSYTSTVPQAGFISIALTCQVCQQPLRLCPLTLHCHLRCINSSSGWLYQYCTLISGLSTAPEALSINIALSPQVHQQFLRLILSVLHCHLIYINSSSGWFYQYYTVI